MLVTAFGPFGQFKVNPSEVLAKRVFGQKVVVLPVSFEAVDGFLDIFPANKKRLVMMGVSAAAKNLQIERSATNGVCHALDVSGIAKPCEPSHSVEGMLFKEEQSCDLWDESHDAGTYLCNYLYYQACTRLAGVDCAFIHVPTFVRVPLELQATRLKRLISKLHRL